MKSKTRMHDDGERAVSAALAIVAVLCFAAPLTHLGDASLWMDELATMQIAAPKVSLADAYWTEMIRDVNPPLYYLLQHFWLQLFNDQAWGGRLLSACLLMASVLLAASLARRTLGWPARALLAAMPVTGFVYIYFATEARSYALALLIGVAQVFVFQSIINDLRLRAPISLRRFSLLGGLCLLNGMTHYYCLIYGCALLAVISVFAIYARRFDVLRRAIITGSVAFGLNVAYLIFSHRYVEAGDMAWLPGDPATVFNSVREFLWLSLGGHHGGALLVVVAVFLMARAYVRRKKGLALELFSAALPHALVIAIVMLGSVALSLFWRPLTVPRYLLVATPSVWLGSALVVEQLMKNGDRFTRRACLAGILLVGLIGLPFAFLSGGSNRENWRASAAFVSQFAGCHNGPVQVYASPNVAVTTLFSFYLNPADHIAPVPPGQAAPRQSCPVKLWAVHGLEDPIIREAERDAASVVAFRNERAWDCWPTYCRLWDRRSDVGALVFLKEAAPKKPMDSQVRTAP